MSKRNREVRSGGYAIANEACPRAKGDREGTEKETERFCGMSGEGDFEGKSGTQADDELLKTSKLVSVLDGQVRLGCGETGEDPRLLVLLLLLLLFGGWKWLLLVREGFSESECRRVQRGETELSQDPRYDTMWGRGSGTEEEREVEGVVGLVIGAGHKTADEMALRNLLCDAG